MSADTMDFGTPKTEILAMSAPGFLECRHSGILQIGSSGLAAFPIGLDVEAQLLALNQSAHSSAFNRGYVDEYVGSATVLLNKAEAFLRIEEFDRAGCHFVAPLNAPWYSGAAQFRVRIRIQIKRFLGESPLRGGSPKRQNLEPSTIDTLCFILQILLSLGCISRRSGA